MPIVTDRSQAEAATAMAAAWLLFVTAAPVFEPDIRRPLEFMVVALGAGGLVIVGFAAASRVRPMPSRERAERLRLVALSLSLGALIGLVNLAVNLGMASLDPSIRRLLVERFADIPTWVSSFAAPVVEETVFRLFIMSVVALLVARFVHDPRVVFWTALAVSALVFGLVHVLRPLPQSLALSWIYSAGVTVKSGLGGVLLGWVFWRWGLGYAIACHCAANSVHWLLEPLVF